MLKLSTLLGMPSLGCQAEHFLGIIRVRQPEAKQSIFLVLSKSDIPKAKQSIDLVSDNPKPSFARLYSVTGHQLSEWISTDIPGRPKQWVASESATLLPTTSHKRGDHGHPADPGPGFFSHQQCFMQCVQRLYVCYPTMHSPHATGARS